MSSIDSPIHTVSLTSAQLHDLRAALTRIEISSLRLSEPADLQAQTRGLYRDGALRSLRRVHELLMLEIKSEEGSCQ